MSDDFTFQGRLSDDKTVFSIKFDKLEYALTADTIRDLIIYLSMRRAEMMPKLSPSVQGSHPLDIWQAEAYEIKDHPETQTAQVFLRLAGLGWSLAEFHPDDCNKLSQALARVQPDGSGTSH